jgi:transposase
MEDSRERRAVIVELRLYGWSARSMAGYLGVHRATVYRTLERWKEKG